MARASGAAAAGVCVQWHDFGVYVKAGFKWSYREDRRRKRRVMVDWYSGEAAASRVDTQHLGRQCWPAKRRGTTRAEIFTNGRVPAPSVPVAYTGMSGAGLLWAREVTRSEDMQGKAVGRLSTVTVGMALCKIGATATTNGERSPWDKSGWLGLHRSV